MKKINTDALLGLIFAVVIGSIFILNIVTPDRVFSDEENRILQQNPEFTLTSFFEGRYEKKAESYIDDQFVLRNQFIKLKTSFDLTLGKDCSNGVYKSADNYLIEEIHKPAYKYKEATLSGLDKFKDKYPSMKTYFLMAPNAGYILKDKLPAGVKMPDQGKLIDAFYEEISDLGYIPVNVTDVLKDAKDSTDIYYRTDHHWTTDGAYIAYKEAAKVMGLMNNTQFKPYTVKNDFRGTLASKSGFVNGKNDAIKLYLPEKNYENSVIYYSDSKKKTTEFYELENLDTKDAYTVFGGSNHPVYTITTPVKTNRKLLLFKDSYANSMIPFLSQNFREIVVVDPRYYFGNIDNIIQAEGITDALFLYNANTFFSDNSLATMLNAEE